MDVILVDGVAKIQNASTGADCPLTDWRYSPLATNPTPVDEFHPLEKEYYTSHVLRSVWPAGLGLAFCVTMAISFAVWRTVHWLKGRAAQKGIDCSTCPSTELDALQGQTDVVDTKRNKISSTKLIQGAVILFSCGSIAGSIYGIVHVDPNIVNDAELTLNSVVNYFDNALDTVEETFATAQLLQNSLDSIENVIFDELQLDNLTDSIQCLSLWLDDLPEPQGLQADVDNVMTFIYNLSLSLNELGNQLDSLASLNEDYSHYEGVLVDLLESENELDELQAQLSDSASKLSLVDAGAPANDTLLRDAMDSINLLLYNPPWSNKTSTLETTSYSLQYIKLSLENMGAELANVVGIALTLTAENSVFRSLLDVLTGQTDAYQMVRPCLDFFSTQISYIDSNIIQLPEEFQAYLSPLISLQSQLDNIFATGGIESGAPGMLQVDIESLESEMSQLGTISTALSVVELDLSSVEALVLALDGLSSTLNGLQANLTYVSEGISLYLEGLPEAPSYEEVAIQVEAIAAAIDSLSAIMQQWLSDAETLYNRAHYLFDSWFNDGYDNLLENALAVIDGILSGGQQLEIFLGYYEQLSNENILSSVSEEMISSVSNINDAVDDAQSSLEEVLNGYIGDLEGFGRATIEQIDKEVDKYASIATRYDRIRQAIVYAIFAAIICLVLILIVSAALLWRPGINYSLWFLLIICTCSFAIIVVLTGSLKVGADGCTNLEAVLENFLETKDPKLLKVMKFYIYNEDSNVTSLLLDTFGVDIMAAVGEMTGARETVLQSLEEYDLGTSLSGHVSVALAATYGIEDGIETLLYIIDNDQINELYMVLKKLLCCRVLDLVGGIWTGLTVASSTIFAASFFAMLLLARLDRMPTQSLCFAGLIKRIFRKKRMDLDKNISENLRPPVIAIRATGSSG